MQTGRRAGLVPASLQMSLLISLLAVGIAAVAAVTARAGGDIELGRYLASECLTCHRARVGGAAIPDLTKIPRDRLVGLVQAYRGKRLANPVMQTIAGRLSDEDIEALALYFSTTK